MEKESEEEGQADEKSSGEISESGSETDKKKHESTAEGDENLYVKKIYLYL